MANKDKYIDIISRFLKNEASVDETKALYSWLKESKENRKQFDEYRELWDALHLKSYEKLYNPKKGWERFNVLVNASENRAKNGISRRLFIKYIKYAAIILVTLALGYLFLNRNPGDVLQDKDELHAIRVPYGQKTTTLLSDGTKVILNSGSSLKYGKDYNVENREVFLEGEAYFEVKENKEKPFVVNAYNIDVSVLGTKFNVKAYPDEGSVEAVLVEGKVKVDIEGVTEKYYLVPNEAINYDKQTRETKKKTNIESADYIKWSEGIIMFRNETLQGITNTLKRWYNVQFEFKDSTIMDYHFTGTFKTDSIEDILSTICSLGDITYEVKNEIFVLMK